MRSILSRVVKRLSYADPLALASLLIAIAAAVYVGYSAYQVASFYSDVEPRYVSDEKYYVDVARRFLDKLLGVEMEYWDYAGTDEDYFNLEHPPLGKFVIAFSIVACGDEPLCWRIPSIAMGALTPLVLWAAYYLAFRGRLGAAAGALAAVTVASDPVFRVMSSVAMLDIYQAFFTALAIAFSALGRFRASAVAAGLAAASKPSGLGVILAVVSLAGASAKGGFAEKLLRALEALLISLAVVAVFYAALIALFAFSPGSPFTGGALERLWHATLYVAEETYNGVRWHATSRPEGPPSSDPIGWIFNENPFYLSYNPLPLPAVTNTLIHAPAFVIALTAFASELVSRSKVWPGPGHVFLSFIYLLYLAVMAAGNRTLYSFYAAQLTPAVAAVMAEVLPAVYMSWRGERK
ncbi:MAG: glycosyltransferase family 39 protein [Desulfurococcales archaeon]|nr:glycosyltransferase family 39 protein [Desulfurococcales archaeon]